jgi:hypothetical protein
MGFMMAIQDGRPWAMASALTNVIMLSGLLAFLRIDTSRNALLRGAFALLACAALNTLWTFVPGFRDGSHQPIGFDQLMAGYWLWLGSFATGGLMLADAARSRLAPTPNARIATADIAPAPRLKQETPPEHLARAGRDL